MHALLLSNIIAPTNATEFWTMVQAVAVSGTLLYAVLQYRTFIDTERLKNTLPFQRAYFTKVNDLMSPQDAALYLIDLLEAERTEKFCNAYTILQNYLDDIDDLYERHAIDRDFIMSSQHMIFQQALEQLGRFEGLPRGLVNSPLQKRMRRRLDEYRKNKADMLGDL